MKRPAESEARVAAPMARVAALRFQTPRMAEPSLSRSVFTAASASTIVTSYAHVSGSSIAS
jgi:hypothetical protein